MATLVILLIYGAPAPGLRPQLMWDRQQHKLPWPPEGCAQACCCRHPTRRPARVGILARVPRRGTPGAHCWQAQPRPRDDNGPGPIKRRSPLRWGFTSAPPSCSWDGALRPTHY